MMPVLKDRAKQIRHEALSWLVTMAAAVAIAFFIGGVLIVNAQVPSGSMESTIMPGDRIIGNRLAYTFSEPVRGEIVLFRYPDDESRLFIKRIIGMPGETVTILDGKVYINGASRPLDEPYLYETPRGSFGPYTVPEGCYFMLGDNRNQSLDSRFWERPYVPKEKICARASFCYYPSLHSLASDA